MTDAPTDLSPEAKAAMSWDEATWPTDEQWLDWFLSLGRMDQMVLARGVLQSYQNAAVCVLQNHRVALQDVAALRQLHAAILIELQLVRRARDLPHVVEGSAREAGVTIAQAQAVLTFALKGTP